MIGWIYRWDPYPFILLNLALSFEAAYAAPIIMMSQNRQADKDRLMAEEDFRVNHVAEDEIRAIITHLERQDQIMLHILARLDGSWSHVRRAGGPAAGHVAGAGDGAGEPRLIGGPEPE